MNPSETQDILSEDTVGHSEDDNMKLVPLSESIRYRKRAQSAEKKVETLADQLAEAKAEAKRLSEQLGSIQAEQKLTSKLVSAGAVDLETAVLIAKARIESQDEADVDGVIEQLKKEKQYLFADTGGIVMTKKTAGAKERVEKSQTVLERAAKKASKTGSRADLQEYLKLRRNFV